MFPSFLCQSLRLTSLAHFNLKFKPSLYPSQISLVTNLNGILHLVLLLLYCSRLTLLLRVRDHLVLYLTVYFVCIPISSEHSLYSKAWYTRAWTPAHCPSAQVWICLCLLSSLIFPIFICNLYLGHASLQFSRGEKQFHTFANVVAWSIVPSLQ